MAYDFLSAAETELFESIEDSGDVQGLAVLVDETLRRARTSLVIHLSNTPRLIPQEFVTEGDDEQRRITDRALREYARAFVAEVEPKVALEDLLVSQPPLDDSTPRPSTGFSPSAQARLRSRLDQCYAMLRDPRGRSGS